MDRLKPLWTTFLSLSRPKKVVVVFGLYMLLAIAVGLVKDFITPAGPSQPMVSYSDAKLDPFKDRSELDSPTPSAWHDLSLIHI
jgi:hypothetical protein